jgi:hypothetical protein
VALTSIVKENCPEDAISQTMGTTEKATDQESEKQTVSPLPNQVCGFCKGLSSWIADSCLVAGSSQAFLCMLWKSSLFPSYKAANATGVRPNPYELI